MLPRFRWRAAGQGGAGLVSLLMVVMILGGLAVLSLSAVDFGLGGSTPDGPAAATPGLGLVPLEPVPDPSPASASGGNRPGSAARQATCEANYRSIESALATRSAMSPTPPHRVEDLTREGWLSGPAAAADPGIILEVVGGTPTGRILVDGQPGPAGCAAR